MNSSSFVLVLGYCVECYCPTLTFASLSVVVGPLPSLEQFDPMPASLIQSFVMALGSDESQNVVVHGQFLESLIHDTYTAPELNDQDWKELHFCGDQAMAIEAYLQRGVD